MHLVRSLCSLSCLAVTLGASAGAQSTAGAPRAPLVARLDSLASAWVAGAPVAGATIAVVKGRDTLLLKAYGERDRERHLPATPTTVYRIGSLTKQFTAAGIMRLVEQRKLALSDPVTKHLPQYPQWSGVTIRQLLDHTSGIHSYTSSAAETFNDTVAKSPAQVVALVEKDTFDFAPGSAWRYNNTGYLLLGMIIEKVSGQPYPEYITSRFLAPLGMRSASFCPGTLADSGYARGYALRYGSIEPAPGSVASQHWSAGGLCMHLPDFLKWQAALTHGRVVRPASFARMSTSDTLSSGAPANYGFGFWTVNTSGYQGVFHTGSTGGFNVSQSWYPGDSLSVVVFSNTRDAGITSFHNNLVAAALGLPLAVPQQGLAARPLPAAERARYVGVYDLKPMTGRDLTVRVLEEGDGLVAQTEAPGQPPQPKIPLLFLGDDTFGAAFDPTLRFTIFFENGAATRARLVVRSRTSEGPRRP